jgi:hypothetical protein
MLGGGGLAPAACDPEISRLVVSQHCTSPSMLCILQFQVRKSAKCVVESYRK